jgi:hypothetical protein
VAIHHDMVDARTLLGLADQGVRSHEFAQWVSIEDMNASDLLVITGAAKQKVGVWLDVQLATSPGRSRPSICKVLRIGSNEAYSHTHAEMET